MVGSPKALRPLLLLLIALATSSAKSIFATTLYTKIQSLGRIRAVSASAFVVSRVSNTRQHFSFAPSHTTTLQALSSQAEITVPSAKTTRMKFVDIGANLLDDRYTEGTYHGKHRHEPDWDQVLQRAEEAGVQSIILTAGTLRESRRAIDLVRQLRQENQTTTIRFGCTVGVHPTRCSREFLVENREDGSTAEQVLSELKALALDGLTDDSVVSLGEIGLDYDRLEFCDKASQQNYLEQQLQAFSDPQLDGLPLFLHNRNVGEDLLQVLDKDQSRRCHGVVHSFDDTLELAEQFMKRGLYIGLNGCSLKTPENLKVVEQLPLDRILLETDCPYCEIKATHAGFTSIQTKWDKKPDKKFELGKMVKGRNEPCQIVQVAEVIASVKGIGLEEVAEVCYKNSCKLYGWENKGT